MVAGKRIAKSPAIIMFTAPYKLCEGGCNGTDEGNIILQFPLFVGKRGRDAYKRIFHRDSEKLYSKDGGMPKKVKPNRMEATTTPCVAVLVNVLPTTTATTTTEDPTTTTPPAPQCPFFPSDVCLKKKKKKTTLITDEVTESPTGQIEDQNLEIPIDNSPSAVALRYDNGDTTYLDGPVTEYNFYDLGYPYLSGEQQRPAFKPVSVCVTLFLLLCMVVESWQGTMPWDRWSWSLPQEPIQYFFRRHENLPVKSPSFSCDCPPNNECVLEFKIDHNMADFLIMRGVVKKQDVNAFREEMKRLELQSKNNSQSGRKMWNTLRNRRSNANDPEDTCCCPPKNVYMPTFITDSKFNEMAKKFQAQKT
ncbi:hypothetical protein SFRURICE_007720 [Spodoptera frugiperda]|nr:hypothetical protein SFRURICE_007720 [Spodoptera frugiperda]